MQNSALGNFTAKLLPALSRDSILGIYTTQLRSFAKQLSKNPAIDTFLQALPHKFLEENILHGLILSNICLDTDTALRQMEQFLPHIDNWMVCDLTCSGLKILKQAPVTLYDRILEWLRSDKPYTQRFALVALLTYFLDRHFTPEMLTAVAAVQSDEYYVNMAIAWFFSTAMVKQYDSTIPYFESHPPAVLSKWVHNKSIQKAIESQRIDYDKKVYLKSLKIQ